MQKFQSFYLCRAFLLLLFLTLPLPLVDILCLRELGVPSPLLMSPSAMSFSLGVLGLLSRPTAASILLSLPNCFWSIPDDVAIFWVAVCFVREEWLMVLSMLPLVWCLPAGLEAILSEEPWMVVWFRPPIFIPELSWVSDESSFVWDSVSLFRSSENRCNDLISKKVVININMHT